MPSRKPPSRIATARSIIPAARIDRRILLIRSHRVMLDSDLADLYGVTTSALNQAVGRNPERFPSDFMFVLTPQETAVLKSQSVISRSAWGGRRKPVSAFTEQGVAMLSSVLRSPRAVAVNIEIMRAFVRIRRVLSTHKALARRIAALDHQFKRKTGEHELHIRRLYELLDSLMNPPAPARKSRIGFKHSDEA